MKHCKGKVCIPFRKDALTLFCPRGIIPKWRHDVLSLCSCMQSKEVSRRQRECFQIPLHHPALKRWGLKFLRRSICKQLLKEKSHLQHCDLNGKGNHSKTFLRLIFSHLNFSTTTEASNFQWRERRTSCTFWPGGVRHEFRVERASSPALLLASDNLHGVLPLVPTFLQHPSQWSPDLLLRNHPAARQYRWYYCHPRESQPCTRTPKL